MTYTRIKVLILLIPTVMVGIWEWVRHQFLMQYISMDTGNYLTPVLVFMFSIILLLPLFPDHGAEPAGAGAGAGGNRGDGSAGGSGQGAA